MIRRVFCIFDKNKDNSISFVEFIQGLSKLSENSNDEAKLRFVFKIYDMDEDGYISNGDLFKILKIMIGNNLTNIQL
jgi:serine/threonine-protein phosphatase 2B regulatory subunit